MRCLMIILTLALASLTVSAQTAPAPNTTASAQAPAASPLSPLRLDSPRDTMRSFLEAMDRYREGVERNDPELKAQIDRALRCLNLAEAPKVLRREVGREAAIYLKEVIDRVIVIDYSKIPEDPATPFWRLRGTEIATTQMTSGEQRGRHLISAETVARAKEFYLRVQKLKYLPGSGQGAGYQPPWYEKHIPAWADQTYLLLPNWQWLAIFMVILLGLLLKRSTKYLLRLIVRLTDRENLRWQHQTLSAIERPSGTIAACLFWFASLYIFQFEGRTLGVLSTLIQVIFSVSIVWTCYRLTDVANDLLLKWASKTQNALDDHLVPLLVKSLRLFVLIFGTLITIQNLGFNVLSVLAGLGLGGLAFALAAKDTCANFFGSLMILMDQPFKVGDWIVTDGGEGTVEAIGFRSTRIRTFYNSVISIPNSNVANMNIDNMGQREFRRVRTTLGVTYDTSPEKLEAFLEGLKNIIKANTYTRKDYFHAVFSGYGDSSLNIMLYFFLKVPDWSAELVERQNIYIEVLRLAQDMNIEFAFPTQTLHVDSFPEKQPTRTPIGHPTEELKKKALSFGPQGIEARPAGLGIFTPPYKEP